MENRLKFNLNLTLGRLLVLLVLWVLGTGPGRTAETGRHVLSTHMAVAGGLAPLGRLPETNQLRLSIGLPLHHQAELDELLNQLEDPRSTNYHRFLTPEEFTARFGPTEQDYQAVIDHLTANGLQVTGRHSNRVVLEVQGSVAGVEQAFAITLHTYRHPTEARDFYAPDTEPSVPTNVPVADLWGLSDYARPRPLVHRAEAVPASPLNYNGSGPGGTYQGADFRNAYIPGATNLAGSGQTVALAEFDSYYTNDIINYEKQISCTNVPLQNILADHVNGQPGYSGQANAVLEVSLDIEMLVSMAPALAKVLVYEGNSPYDVLEQIVTDNLAKQVSSSWAWSLGPSANWNLFEPGSTLDSLFEEMGAQGQTFFQASGDSDAYTGNDALSPSSGPIPVDSIYVTSVGGTSLTMNGTGANWSSETVWNWGLRGSSYDGSGGGISTNYNIPAWQTNVSMAVNGGSTLYRNIPDVALTADAVHVDYNNGSSVTVGGTSCAAPLWAAFAALINQQSVAGGGPTNTVGFLNPALYAIAAGTNYTACFHDITNGNNIGGDTPGLFYATNGYDLCTGLGTPAGTNLINLLAPRPCCLVQPAGRYAPYGGTVSLSVIAGGQPALAYAWLFNGGALAGTNVAGVPANTLTLTNLTSANAGNYSVVVTNIYGAVTSSVAALTLGFPPVVTTPPAGATNLVGSTAQFTVTATGTAPLACQWLKNGVSLANGAGVAGAMTNQLTLTAVGTNSGGNYAVVITNLYGSVTSSAAMLTVFAPPVITTLLAGQTVECSSNATFAVTVAGWPPPVCQWSLDGTALAGATNTSITLTNVHMPNHTVGVVVTNAYGGTTNSVTLTVQDTQPPVITLNGANPFYVELGTAFTDPGATAMDACEGAVAVTVTGAVNPNALGTNHLVYSAQDGNGNSSQVTRQVIVRDTTPPTIEWSFTNLVLAAGTNCQAAMLNVTGTNYILAMDLSGPPVISQYPPTNTLLSLGTNRVILTATDTSGNAAHATNTLVVADETAPVIVTQPQNATNNIGGTASFSLTATACTPLTYQWLCNGYLLSGQTNATLTLSAVNLTNAGNYAAVAMATGGSTTSSVAVLAVVTPPVIQWSFTNLVLAAGSNCEAALMDVTGTNYIQATVWSGVPVITQSPATNTVLPLGTNLVILTVTDTFGNTAYSTNTIVVADETAPVILSQPQNATNNIGGTASFSLTATACTPLTYQWLCNGYLLSGQTNATLTLSAVNLTNAGNYAAVAMAAGGSTTSAVAVLAVVTPPVIQWSFTNLVLAAGSNCEAALMDVTGTNYIQATVWSGVPVITQSPATNTALPLGTNLVVLTVSDAYGNTVYSTHTIMVADETVPVIVSQPQNATNNIGGTASFALTATACTPLSYQWLCNGWSLSGQTNATLTLSSLDPTNAGNYAAVATAAGGSTTSSVAVLAVVTPPVIQWSFTNLVLAADSNCEAGLMDLTGTNYLQATVWSGVPIITQSPGTNTALPLGTNVVVLTVSDTFGNTAYSTNTIVVADETAPVIVSQPQNATNNIGGAASFSLTATACTPLSYQWLCNGYSLSGQTNATLTLSAVNPTNAGNYTAVATAAGGCTTSSVVVLAVVTPPVIQWSFTNLVLAADSNCEAGLLDVTGTNYILATVWSGEPSITQSPATNTVLPLGTNLVILTVTDTFGNTAYSTNTIVVADETAPVVVTQPQNATNNIGGTASFTLTATACTPLSYQWLYNGYLLSGQTNSMLTLSALDPTNAGNYAAVATAAGGSATSSVAVLAVVTPPVIQWSFTNLVLAADSNCEAGLMDVTGTNYIQTTVWSGVPVITQSPATNTALPLGTNVVVLTVSDTFGNTAYSTNTIVVADETAPVIVSQPQNATNNIGGTASFTLTATACTPLTYQWLFNGNPLCGQTNTSLMLAAVDPTNAGNYTAVATAAGGCTTSSVAVLAVAELAVVTPPVIQWSFTNLVLAADSNCEAALMDLTGTNYILATVWSGEPVITQSPATNTALPLGTNVVVLTVSDTFGNTVYSTNTVVVADETAPVIISDLQSQTNTAGGAASFTLTATACTPLTYRWMFNGNLLLGQTNDSLTLSPLDFTNAGNYAVVAAAAGGCTTSSVANLTVVLADTPLVLSVVPNPGGGMVLNLTGPPEATGILEMTTNLGMFNGWQCLDTNVLDINGAAQFIDFASTNDAQRFYRALLGQ